MMGKVSLTRREAIEKAVSMLKEGKSGAEVRGRLVSEYAYSHAEIYNILAGARYRVSQEAEVKA